MIGTVKKGVIVGIIVVVILIGALAAIGMNAKKSDDGATTAASNNNNEEQKGSSQQNEDRIAALLGNDPNRINNPGWRQTAQEIIRTETMDNALLVINADTSWSAVVQGSDFVQQTVDGTGSKSIDVKCDSGGIFSHVVQKGTEDGALNVYMAKDGHIIKQGSTTADYGVVSLSGTC